MTRKAPERRPWTKDEIALTRAMKAKGLGQSAIAAELRRAPGSVSSLLHRIGLTKPILPEDARADVRAAYYRADMPVSEIKAQWGITNAVLYKILGKGRRRHPIKRYKRSLFYTTTEIGRVKFLHALGWMYKDIAKDIGRSEHSVRRFCRCAGLRRDPTVHAVNIGLARHDRWTDEQDDLLRELSALGYRDDEIGRVIDRGPKAVRGRRRAARIHLGRDRAPYAAEIAVAAWRLRENGCRVEHIGADIWIVGGEEMDSRQLLGHLEWRRRAA